MDTLPPEIFILTVAVASAFIGGLLVWIVGILTGGSKGQRQRRQPPPAARQAGPEASASADEQELLLVSRAKKDKPDIFVQGQRYRHLREITDPQMGRDTVEALKAVLAFAEGWLPSPQQSPLQPASSKPNVDGEAFLAQLRQSDLFPASRPTRPPSRSRTRISSTLQKPLLTPAEAIDELVQQRLQERPELAKRGIRLTIGGDGSLCIHVGLQTFGAVNDVTDAEVRTLIQDVIHEWEAG